MITKKLGVKDCKSLIDKVRNRVQDWRNRNLTYAGRLQLIASILSSMQVYWASVFILPKAVIREINKLLKRFLWCQGEVAKGRAKVSWDNICKPKDQGGLGIKNLQIWNEVLIMKHLWNVAAKKDTLWVKWISVEKLKGRSIWEGSIDKKNSIGWNNILKLREKIRIHVGYKIGNGKSISAWHDRWCNESPLSDFISARELYNARFNGDCTVDKIISNGIWSWPDDWFIKFPNLRNIQIPTLLNDTRDKVEWITNNGLRTEFATKVVWKDLCCSGNKVIWNDLVWFSQSIPKHSFILWMAIKGRLMTQDRIAVWNPNGDMKCVFCKQCLDSHAHLFFLCQYTNQVWKEMQKLLDKQFSDKWENIIEEFSSLKANRNIWSIIRRLVLGAAVYFVWQERNTRLFQNCERNVNVLVQSIMECIKWRIMNFVVKDTEAVKEVEKLWNVQIKRVKSKAE